MSNIISNEPRTEKVFKLKCNTDVVLSTKDKDKAILPEALIYTILYLYPKLSIFQASKLNPPFESIYPIHNANADANPYHTNTDRNETIRTPPKIYHLNEEEKELITNLCLEFIDIFYVESDQLIFTNEIKHSIETGNSRPIFTKYYRYPQVRKAEVKMQMVLPSLTHHKNHRNQFFTKPTTWVPSIY